MKTSKQVYYLTNLIFVLSSILFINFSGIMDMKFSLIEILILLFLFILIHVFKFLRIYFILLEEMIPLSKMIKIYIKTTFVSTALPFKIGEIFKMYSYGEKINNYPKGIIAVLIEKFFDAFILCLVLIPYSIYTNRNIMLLTLIMLIFLIIVFSMYISFKETYYYLNKFFVMRDRNKRSIYILNFLEKINEINKLSREMLKGRQIVIFCLSALSWISEAFLIYKMAEMLAINIDISTLFNYINDGFFGLNNLLFNNYTYLCTFIFLIIMAIIYFIKFIRILSGIINES